MALSGKTTNFELKYPELSDDIVMSESGNDFKEMMDSVDSALSDVNDHSGKKYSTIVIGNSRFGHTADEVDFLYNEFTDFATTLTNAINALPFEGGEIKILSGPYLLLSAVTIEGTQIKPIKITGEGKSTIIRSDAPESQDITASYCEISECRLETNIRITTNGYVNIHDCEIAKVIHLNNNSTVQDIFIHDNNLDLDLDSDTFLRLSGTGAIDNLQVYNNYCFISHLFTFLKLEATKIYTSCGFYNNHCAAGSFGSTTYLMTGNNSNYDNENIISNNVFYDVSFQGTFWNINNNTIKSNFSIRVTNSSTGRPQLDIFNNLVNGSFSVEDGAYVRICNNFITYIEVSPYIDLSGGNNIFVGNVIQVANFGSGSTHTYLIGLDVETNKIGNNMWADGIDRLVFANGEEIGQGQ